MRKITREEYIYRYSELSDSAKRKAREDYLEGYPLFDDLEYVAQNLLQQTLPNAEYDNISYDLSYNQGSGAVIEFSYSNLTNFLRDFPFIQEFLSKKHNLEDVEMNDIGFKFTCKSDIRYCFSKYNYVFDCYDYDDFTTDLDEFLYQQLEDYRSTLREQLDDIEKTFTRSCYDYYENLGMDEEIYDGMWFYVNGDFAGFDDEFGE